MSRRRQYALIAVLLAAFLSTLSLFEGIWKVIPVAGVALVLLGKATYPWVSQAAAKRRFPEWKARNGIPERWSFASQEICEELPNAQNPLVLTALYMLSVRETQEAMNFIASDVESEADYATPTRETLRYWDQEFAGTLWPQGEHEALLEALTAFGPRITEGEGPAFVELSWALSESSVPPSAVGTYIRALSLDGTTYALKENLPIEYAAAMFGPSDGVPSQ